MLFRLPPHKLLGMRHGFGIAFLAERRRHVPSCIPAYYEIEPCRERARRNPFLKNLRAIGLTETAAFLDGKLP